MVPLGRMGQAVVNLAESSENFEIVAKTDVNIPISSISVIPDVIIDFSIPASTMEVLEFAKTNNVATVIATTGFDEIQNNKILEYSKDFPIFKSANMSIGINLMLELISKAAQVLQDEVDIEIIEKHHNKKVDAPSGTALLLADEIKKVITDAQYCYERQSKKEARKKNEIGIHAVRGGTIVGEHSVLFLGADEVLEIKHNVFNRSIFANGSLIAAKWLVNKENGLYSMKDLI